MLIVKDRNGKAIHVGDNVIWHDFEMNTTSTYEVYEVREDMVKLANQYGECEALPEECEVV